MNNIFLLLNMTNSSSSEFKLCVNQFEPRVKPFLKLVGINIETTRNLDEYNVSLNDIVTLDDVSIIFNGHLYNTSKLVSWSGADMTKKNNFEIIIILYIKYGIEHAVSMLDGKFSFVIIDHRISMPESYIYIVQDSLGTQPLYLLKNINPEGVSEKYKIIVKNNTNVFAISSSIENLDKTCKFLNNTSESKLTCTNIRSTICDDILNVQPYYNISRIVPGSYLSFSLPLQVSARWKIMRDQPVIYNRIGRYSDVPKTIHLDDCCCLSPILRGIQNCFIHAISKRCKSAEGVISCIVNGSVESCIIASLVSEYCRNNNLPKLRTYSIRFASDVRDIERIDVLVDYIKTIHTEIVIPDDKYDKSDNVVVSQSSITARESGFLDNVDLEQEQSAITREDIAYRILGKRIAHDCDNAMYESETNDIKTVFCTLGAKSILYGENTIACLKNPLEFDISCRDALAKIVEVSATSAYKYMETNNNIQCVFPFLDNDFIQNYFSISPLLRTYVIGQKFNGNILKSAFAPENKYRFLDGKEILPCDFLRFEKLNRKIVCETISNYSGDILSM